MNLEDFLKNYEQHAASRAELKTQLLGVEVSQSAIVKQIAELIAPKKKFMHNGREVTIVSRGETWFFRGFDERKRERRKVMGYAIDSVDTPVLKAWMHAQDIVDLFNANEDDDESMYFPEDNFILDHYDEACKLIESKNKDSKVKLKSFNWNGEGANTDNLVEYVVPKIIGRVEALLRLS